MFSVWFSLTQTVAMACEKLPSPLDMSAERVEKLMSVGARQFDLLPEQTQELKKGMHTCSYCTELKEKKWQLTMCEEY